MRHFYLASEEEVAAKVAQVEAQDSYQKKLSQDVADIVDPADEAAASANKSESKGLLSWCACFDPQAKKKKALAQQ